MGLAHDGWKDNLRLSVSVQQQLTDLSPTLMRPIAARGYRYNQHLHPGSLLVEVGAAGNSLDEALLAARYFATGFANTILPPT
jgi:stage II sporulation protein P